MEYRDLDVGSVIPDNAECAVISEDRVNPLAWDHTSYAGTIFREGEYRLGLRYRVPIPETSPDASECPRNASDAEDDSKYVPDAPKLSEGHTDDANLVDEAFCGERGSDQQRLAQKGMALLATLIRKNTDYNCSAWKSPCLCSGMTPREGIQCRMSDKVQRLQKLLGKESTAQVQESIEDTMQDLAGYAVLWLAAPEESK